MPAQRVSKPRQVSYRRANRSRQTRMSGCAARWRNGAWPTGSSSLRWPGGERQRQWQRLRQQWLRRKQGSSSPCIQHHFICGCMHGTTSKFISKLRDLHGCHLLFDTTSGLGGKLPWAIEVGSWCHKPNSQYKTQLPSTSLKKLESNEIL